MNERSGHLKTNLSGEAAYESFVPSPLPPTPPVEMGDDMVACLVEAHARLAALDGVATRIPNLGLLVSMYVRKEALLSSQIEGTQATLEDILDPSVEANANRDVEDVVNYVRAIEFAVDRLEDLPLCNRLLKEAHAVLMEGARGQEKSPGEFRRSQNWIGGQGCTLREARYIPSSPDDMARGMADLESYMHGDDGSDVLVRAALVHYQFETIHPFLDGNGRVGRLLIVLFLMEKGVLATPALYVSYFLKKHRVEYYDRMTEVRERGSYEQWVKFFLEALAESARDATATIDELAALHDRNAGIVSGMGRGAKNAMRLFSYLEANPIVEVGKTAQALDIAFNTASDAVRRLVDAGILRQAAGGGRNRAFAYEDYLAVLRRGT